MTYRIDDGECFAAAVLAAGNEAYGALKRAGAWSAAPSNLTDGHIPLEVARQIAPARIWTRLRTAHLTEAPSDGRSGEQIVGYLTHNPSAEKVRQERAAWTARQARSRESRRDAPRDETPQSRPCHGVTPNVTHGPVTASSSSSISGSGSISEELSLAGEREEPVTTPEAAPLTLAELAKSPGRADGGLLGVLVRKAEAEHPWCVSTAQRVLERGGRLTDPERARLREIDAEGSRPTPSSSRPAISLQPPAKPGEHTWTPGEEHRF